MTRRFRSGRHLYLAGIGEILPVNSYMWLWLFYLLLLRRSEWILHEQSFIAGLWGAPWPRRFMTSCCCQLVSRMLRNTVVKSSHQHSLLEHSAQSWRESNSRRRERRRGKKVIRMWRYLLPPECLAFNWGSFSRLSILKPFLFHALSQHLFSQAICLRPFALKFWQTPTVITH